MFDSAETETSPIDEAPAADWSALLAGFRHLLPPAGEAPLWLDLPLVSSAQDTVDASSNVIAAAAAGEITLREAQGMMRLLTGHTRMLAAARRARRAR